LIFFNLLVLFKSLHADVQRLVDKQKLLWKDDLKFLQKSFNQAIDTRVHGFASDFNNLYKARLEEIAALKRSGENC